jgi:hypothetical protein
VGNNEKNFGSTFVQFSRLKKLVDFLVKPFPFDRLQKIASSTLLFARKKEGE